MISPLDMTLFAAVVREGSFTRAARRLGITKQTVSERVANLERELGVRLLERTTRRLRVTDPGATYYERCAAIAAQIDEANREVKRRQAEPIGVLRMSAPVLYGRRFLAPVLAPFVARYPELRIEVVLADRRVHLIEEGFDLAIRVGPLDDSAMTLRKLGEAHLHVVASPRFANRVTPERLADTRCVGTKTIEHWTICGVTRAIEPVLVVNDLEVVCEAAIAGAGIAFLPALVCRDAVRAGRLRVLFGPEPMFVVPVYAVYPSREYLPARIRLVLDAIAEHVEPMLTLAHRRPQRS